MTRVKPNTMKTILCVISFLVAVNLSAQMDESLAMSYVHNPALVSPPSEIVASASFPGGSEAFREYVSVNLVYPDQARAYAVEGVVRAEFKIGPTGKAEDIKILSDLGYGCGAEVARLIREMPRWYPALENGMATTSRKRNVAIAFRLR